MVGELVARAMEQTAWPDKPEVRPLMCAFFLFILTVLSVINAIRFASIGFSWERWTRLSLARRLILFTLLDSWLFCYASAVLLFGVGSAMNETACEVGIWWCVILYASSKVTIYLFLMERLHVVQSGHGLKRPTFKDRFSSWWYRIAFVMLIGWIAVAITMIVGRNATLYENGTCKIGLKIWASVPMLTVDALVNIFLTAGFVMPVFRAGFNNAAGLAKESCIAAVLALTTSFANIFILALFHGHQMSYVCLGSCVFDVAANSCILFWISRHNSRGSSGGETYKSGGNAPERSHGVMTGKSSGHFRNGSSHLTSSGVFEGVGVTRTQQQHIDGPDGPDALPRMPVPSFNIADQLSKFDEISSKSSGTPFSTSTDKASYLTPDNEKHGIRFADDAERNV